MIFMVALSYHQTPNEHDSGITFFGGKSSHVDAFLCFHLKLRASHLLTPPYSEYQQFLYDTIMRLLKDGYNYKQIADWMNENGYKTPRGKKFRNAHAHSIVKKKKARDVKISKTYEPIISNFSLKFIDRTLIN
jgi:hypothetical protein